MCHTPVYVNTWAQVRSMDQYFRLDFLCYIITFFFFFFLFFFFFFFTFFDIFMDNPGLSMEFGTTRILDVYTTIC